MTAKEKAKELYDMSYEIIQKADHFGHLSTPTKIRLAKDSVLLAIDNLVRYTKSVNGNPPNLQRIDEYCNEYWNEVKKEIEIL